MKNYFLYAIVILTTAFILSCRETLIEDYSGGVIKGRITMENIPSDSAGVPNKKIYLLDTKAKIDTVNFDNRHVYVDSAITDSQGRFEFNYVKEGEYQLFPVNEKGSHLVIEPNDGDINRKINISNGEVAIADFTQKVYFSWGGAYYIVNLKLQNLVFKGKYPGENGKSNVDKVLITATRRQWDLFIPHRVFANETNTIIEDKKAGDIFDLTTKYVLDAACTYILMTWDNHLRFRVAYNYDLDHPVDIIVELPFSFPERQVDIDFDYKLLRVTRVAFR